MAGWVAFQYVGVLSVALQQPPARTVPRPAIPSLAPPHLLHDEAAAGDANAVGLLLAAGIPGDMRNVRGSTALHVAALNGHDAVAATLLGHGASADAANEEGNTPLHAAVHAGQLECARLLLRHGASAGTRSNAGISPLRIAAQAGHAEMLSALIEGGGEMCEEAANDAFWAACALCEAEGESLSPAAPRLLHHVFDADMAALRRRAKAVTNVTCLQPVREGSGYDVVNDELLQVELGTGRACDGGECCEACSRVHFPAFATPAEADAFLKEINFAIVPPFNQFSLQKCAFRDTRTTLLFVRMVERMRRSIAEEWGLPLATVSPMQTFVAKFDGAQAKQGGLHSDEATHKEFHYSCVLYLTTQHEDFEGGTLHFNDAGPEGDRVLTPLSPSKGAAIIFSSGWENMHEVEPLASGTRVAIPGFFTTCPSPEAHLTSGGGGAAVTDYGALGETLQRTLLQPESVSDFREFQMKWHSLLAPGR